MTLIAEWSWAGSDSDVGVETVQGQNQRLKEGGD